MNKNSIKKLVFSALFTALITISTMFIRIPLPLGYVNMGDAFIFLAVFILGPLYGTLAAALGSAIADIVGYVVYAPGTLIIKTLMAVTTYYIYHGLRTLTNKNVLAEIIAGLVGSVVMALGYFLYETLFFETAAVAILNAPWNIVQGIVGIALAVAVMRVLEKTKLIYKLKQD